MPAGAAIGVLTCGLATALALAVTGDGASSSGLEQVSLTNLGTVRGGVPLTLVGSPGYPL